MILKGVRYEKRITCILFTVLMVLSALPASSATSISESKPLLSEMSESECIAFVKECGITLPPIYDNEAEWGQFIKAIITMVENDPYTPISTSYTVTAELEQKIRNAVNNYYGIEGTNTVPRMLNTNITTSNWLEDSTEYSEWDPDFAYYNCYSYSIGITDVALDPGMITAMEEYPANPENWNIDILNLTIEEIRDLVISDLETRGETRIIYRASEMDTTNLCINESVICVRMGPEDYHFMKFTADGWLHKPSRTQILKYNYVPTESIIWTNERVYMGQFYEATTQYDSAIYFISYNGHNWSYTSHGNCTHTKSCSICDDAFTSNCNYSYTYLGDDMHNANCVDCNNVIPGGFCSFTVTSNGDGTHTRSCNGCSNTYTESCDLEYTNLTNTRHSVACAACDYSVSSQSCTLTYTSNGNKTHTVSCSLCGNDRTVACSIVSEYASSNQHFNGCTKCGAGSLANCVAVYTYCGNDSLGDVHKQICKTCGHAMNSGTQTCTLAYKYNGQVDGSNTHVYACTACDHIDSGPTLCTYIGTKPCLQCGSVKDQVSINTSEEESAD